MIRFDLSPSIISLALVSLLLSPPPDNAGAARAPEINPARPPAGAGAPAAPAGATPPAAQTGFVVIAAPLASRSAAEMKKLLAPLLSPGGAVLEQPGGKALTLVDTPSNLEQLVAIKDLLDAPALAAARLEIFEPKVASAEELAAGMTEVTRYILAAGASGASPAEFIPYPRTNQLLVAAAGEPAWNQARQWLERIDAASAPPRRIFVYPVEPGKAGELAAKLSQAKAGAPRVVADAVAGSLIIHGTAKDFEEIKKLLAGERELEEFKRRLAALRRRVEGPPANPSPPPSP